MNLAILLAATSAIAADGDHHLDAAILTDFPVMVGANVTYEAPSRLRGELNGGVIPGPYVDTINWAMTTFDVYSENVANLIDLALRNTLVLRPEIGFRPLPNRGLTVALGYQYLFLGGDTADVQYFTENIEGDLAAFAQDATGDLEVQISNHMIHGEVGYEWLVKERLVLRSTLGFAYTVRANTTVTPTREADNAAEQELIDEVAILGEDYLDYVFEEWVHLPMVGVHAGWRFR